MGAFRPKMKRSKTQPQDHAWPIAWVLAQDRYKRQRRVPLVRARDPAMMLCQSWVTGLLLRRRVSPFQQP